MTEPSRRVLGICGGVVALASLLGGGGLGSAQPSFPAAPATAAAPAPVVDTGGPGAL